MAENLVAAPVISAAFNVLFDRVVKEFMNYVRSKANFDPCVLQLKLKTTMLALSAVLNDAKERQITDLTVLEWLEELTSVIYDAEDLQDDIRTEALKSKVRAECQMSPLDNVPLGNNQIPYNASSYSDQSNHGSIAAKLIDLCGRLDVFLPQVSVLGLGESCKVTENKRSHTPIADSITHGTITVGRESEREKIMSFLAAPDGTSGVRLVVIVGLAGVGKTTFAQMLYDDPRLKGTFDFKSWVSISAAIDTEWVIKGILESMTNREAPIDQLEKETALSKALLGKNLLLVLDDVGIMEENFWDNLYRPLKAGPKGVTIVITARDDNVASRKFCTQHILQLNPLCDADCWSLLKGVAFGSEEATVDEALQNSGKQIAEKCNGSPLAAKVLGGILRFTRDVDDWDSILRSKVWQHMCYTDDILPALRLSYSYLPSHLKRCFSYCSIFPKNYKFEKDKLVLLWIAEGFIQVSKNEASLEEVGNSYFQELFSRSLLQQSSCDSLCFEMHDMVYDFAKHVSSDICFMLKADNPQVCPSKIRHFSYIQTKHDTFEYFKAVDGLVHFGNLRTFLPLKSPLTNLCCLDIKQAQCFFPQLIYLRALSLSHYNITEIPQSLSNLKHLRFLDLSQTPIKQLSPFVCNLYNLYTLLLQRCPYLTNLPERLGNLVSLRHLDISGSSKLQEMPIAINNLNKVYTLTNFVVGEDSGAKLSALSKFHNLRGHLFISGLQNVVSVSDASEANMKSKMHLDELTLEWVGETQSPSKQEQVCHLLKPGTSLKKINISSYGGRKLANWIGATSFSEIVSASLINCYRCSRLPPLGQLPSLKKLHIANFPMLDTVGPEFYANVSSSMSAFQALEILKIEKMSEWKVWSQFHVDIETFGSLQELCLENCPKLSEHLPRNLPSLLKLDIINCSELTGSLPELPAIHKLRLQECKRLDITTISTLTSLVSLDIRGVGIYHSLASDLRTLNFLVELNLVYFEGLQNSMMLSNDDNNRQLVPGYTMLIGESIRDLSIRSSAFQLICPVSSLRSLNISHCNTLELNVNYFSSLQSLDISHCGFLESFPLEIFPMLIHLKIEQCSNLEEISLRQGDTLLHLFELSIITCPNLLKFPNQGLPAPNLSSFSISNCKRLKWLPSDMNSHLTSLQFLSVVRCQELHPIPAGGLPPNLHTLRINSCPKLFTCQKSWRAHPPASVQRLYLDIPLQG